MSFVQAVAPEQWFGTAIAFGVVFFLLQMNCRDAVRYADILFYEILSSLSFLCMMGCFLTALVQEVQL
jgi:hypothetical protein